jgi:hypothetical protein
MAPPTAAPADDEETHIVMPKPIRHVLAILERRNAGPSFVRPRRSSPSRLQAWMGHKRIDETMRYTSFASLHMRPIPPEVRSAGVKLEDPDQRIVAMLGARHGILVAPTEQPIE